MVMLLSSIDDAVVELNVMQSIFIEVKGHRIRLASKRYDIASRFVVCDFQEPDYIPFVAHRFR
jgi:hypothetical protein